MSDLARQAIGANLEHQSVLSKYRDNLEQQIKDLDARLATINDAQDEEPHICLSGYIDTSTFKRPGGPFYSSQLLSPISPFYKDAIKRENYLTLTVPHPFQPADLDKLTAAVRTNYAMPRPRENSDTEEIHWDIVAESMPERSSTECRVQWLGSAHPKFNRGKWTQQEIAKLKGIVNRPSSNPINWVVVAQEFGGTRSPLECLSHGQKRPSQAFNEEMDKRLAENVSIYGVNNWGLVARHLTENALTAQCQTRYAVIDPSNKRGAWTEEEQQRLRNAVAAYGKSWADVANAMPGRTNGQCRDRWTDFVNPALKTGKWTEDEDQQLCDIVAEFGERWQKVADEMKNGRTDNSCRTRFEKLLKDDSTLERGPSSVEMEGQSERPFASAIGHRSTPQASSSALPPVPDSETLAPVVKSKPKPRPLKARANAKVPSITSGASKKRAADDDSVLPSPKKLKSKAQFDVQDIDQPEESDTSLVKTSAKKGTSRPRKNKSENSETLVTDDEKTETGDVKKTRTVIRARAHTKSKADKPTPVATRKQPSRRAAPRD